MSQAAVSERSGAASQQSRGAWTHDPARFPVPARERWQPLRSGLMNLFLFENEVFLFADGRLLLRGNNGTGKSRVLALQLPFLLDGEVHPHRVEPDGDPAKRMEWHLLMGGRYPDRIGYTWLELGRRDPEAGPRYLTLGIGMQAIQGRGAPTRWFFLTERRVGLDLHLMTPERTPLTRQRLQEAIGDRGEVFSRARDYREAVDRALFRLGPERYEALLELLIQLRRPQLSRRLDEEQLNRALSDALPPLPESVLGEVAEAFRGLEADRDALRAFEQAAAATERFNKPYRRYAQIVTRRRAERVRQAHSRYETTLRELREAEARIAQAEQAQASCQDRLGLLERELGAADVEIRTLEASDEMRSVRELERAVERAERAAEDAAAAAKRLDEAEAAHWQRQVELEAAQHEQKARGAEAREDLAACEQWGVQAGLGRDFEAVLAGFEGLLRQGEAGSPFAAAAEDPAQPARAERLSALEAETRKAIATFGERVEQRRRGARHLEAREQERAAAEQRLRERASERDRVEEELSAAYERRQDAADARQRAEQDLLEAYRAWAGQVEVLAPPGAAAIAEELADWAEVGRGPSPVAAAVAAALDAALERLHEERAEARARVAGEQAELEALQQELEALRAGRHRPPAPSPFRDPAARTGQAGAPLWALCDWAEGVSSEEQAGLEAALEAAGLLDAWIAPDGEVLGESPGGEVLLDAWLGPRGEPVAGPSLADKVRPVGEGSASPGGADGWGAGDGNAVAGTGPAAVAPDVVRGVLARIGLGPSGAPVWVDGKGRYGLGPAQGRWRKPHAEHLGASTREAARRRRIAELEARRTEQAARLEQAEAALAAVHARSIKAQSERRSAPGDEELRDALAALAQAEREVAGRRMTLEDAEARLTEARDQVSTLAREIAEEAADLGLAEWVDRLGALRELLVQLAQAVHGLSRWVRQLGTATRNVLAAAERERAAAARLAARRQEAAEAAARATRAQGARKVLEETAGAAAQEVIERLQRVRGRQDRLRQEQRHWQAEERAADVALAEARADQRNRAESLQELVVRRDEAVAAFARLVETGLPRLAGAYGGGAAGQAGAGGQAAADAGEAAAAGVEVGAGAVDAAAEAVEAAGIGSPTRAVEVARQAERHLGQVDHSQAAWDRATAALHQRIAELETELGVHGLRPHVSEQDGLRLVTVTFQGSERSMDEMARLLRQEVADRQRILAESERQVIENHLIDEVSAQLHERLRQGERLVAAMNAELESRPTSTGMRLRFAWTPRRDDPPGWTDARKLLLATANIWSPQERQAIGRFLQQRVEAVRETGQALTWRDQLAEAFDYRRWHRFVVSRFADGAWHPLTRRTHGTGSGGEKALALTLPQLAAAAAHYGSAHEHAPRLILLDEAFVGVDRTMRGQCMGLLTAFDLDVVLTSEREWGCYATVPALAIYHLTRHPDLDAVFATRWVWNGAERLRGDVPSDGAAEGREVAGGGVASGSGGSPVGDQVASGREAVP